MDRSDGQAALIDPSRHAIAFLWEHLGPPHHDRLRAVNRAGHRILAVELFARSAHYRWDLEGEAPDYARVTLAGERAQCGTLRLAGRIVHAILSARMRAAFLCHYNEMAVFFAALALRLAGVRVVTMLDSKADDRSRSRISAVARRIMLLPYHAALVATPRSADYVADLGIPEWRTALHYNAFDVAVLKSLGEGAAPVSFVERPFLAVGRLIPEKNFSAVLAAFARYREAGGKRRLVIVGEGPERPPLDRQADCLGIAEWIDWPGVSTRKDIAQRMRRALALLLPSTSETYGFVVIEALAQGLIPIVSRRAGAVDLLLEDQRNGYVVDPRSVDEICAAMMALDCDESRWRRMSAAAESAAERADVRHFVASVEQLAER